MNLNTAIGTTDDTEYTDFERVMEFKLFTQSVKGSISGELRLSRIQSVVNHLR